MFEMHYRLAETTMAYYTRKLVFKEPGLYSSDISVLNAPDMSENITFTSPVRIYDPVGEYFAFLLLPPLRCLWLCCFNRDCSIFSSN